MKHTGYLLLSVLLFATLCVLPLSAETLYVNALSAAVEPDGSSWALSYSDLQDALAVASSETEIWVAAGTYLPGSLDRTAVFTVPEGVELYGGFAGTEDTLAERDVEAYPTILSGDLNGDDPVDTSDNAYTVVELLNESVIDGFTVTGGHSNGATETIERFGGGIYTNAVRATIRHCLITGNYASYGGGLVAYSSNQLLFVENCSFDQNTTANTGGAIRLISTELAYILNCRFTRNTGDYTGGAVYLEMAPAVIHGCVFAGNEAVGAGGAIYSYQSALTLSNNTFVGNRADEGSVLFLEGNYQDGFIRNNIFADNTGLTRTAKQIGGGGYFVVSNCLIPEGLASTYSMFTEGIIAEEAGLVDADGADDIYGTDDDNYALTSDSACIDAGTNRAALPDIAALMGREGAIELLLEPLPDLSGNDRIVGKHVDIGALENQDQTYTPTVHYVMTDATGAADGSSWADAFPDLQSALDTAPGAGDEIWVAEGSYAPSTRAIDVNNDKGITFILPGGVSLYGGFSGTESSRDERDPEVHPTILSGDLLGDDEDEGGGISDNVASILRGCNLLLLDGFVIERAYYTYATSQWPAPDGGAGLRNVMASPWVRNCHFRDIQGRHGAGVYNQFSMAGFSQSTFEANTSEYSIVEQELSGCRWIDCEFIDNLSTSITNTYDFSLFDGCVFENNADGVMQLFNSIEFLVRDCRFTGNSGTAVTFSSGYNILDSTLIETNSSGYGLILGSTDPSFPSTTNSLILNCDFRANTSAAYCGGNSSGSRFYNCRFWENFNDRGASATVNCVYASPWFINCLFWGNKSDAMEGAHYDGKGGCLSNFGSSPTFINCTFANNYADEGSVFYNSIGSHPKVYNSILWGNTGGAQIVNMMGTSACSTTIVNSIVEGGYGGEGNLNENPLFYDPNGADGIWGNTDDDFRLSSGSPALDTGDNTQLPADTYDLDGDGDRQEVLPVDLFGYTRIQSTSVDMGALEGDAGIPDFPNLVVQSITIDPVVGGYLEEMTFTVTVKNTGAFAADSFLVGFWPRSTSQPTDFTVASQTAEVDSLAAGATTTVDFLYTPTTTVTRPAWAYVNAEALTERIDETNQSDNWIDEGFIYEVIIKYVDLIITDVVTNPNPPVQDEEFNFEITVENIGDGSASRFYVSYFQNIDYFPSPSNSGIDEVECADGLAAGESTVLTLPRSVDNEDTYESWFVANSNNAPTSIYESDKDNNRFPTGDEPFSWKAEDGLADAWEIAVLGSTAYSPEDDPDGDGFTILYHYQTGTSLTGEDPPFSVRLVHEGSNLKLEFLTVETDASYGDLQRHYRIETLNDLREDWATLSGYGDIPADGSTFSLDLGSVEAPVFYRCVVWVE